MPTDLVVRNAPAVAALCGWVSAGARDDKSNGQTCGGANECASGFCVGGLCCATATCGVTPVYQVDCGSSSAVSPFSADRFSSGGTARTVTNSISTSGLTNAAPQAVYQSERFGNVTYTFPSLVASASYTVRLHFAELFQTAAGKRLFNVAINGTTVLSSFDIFAATGAAFKATLREFTTTATSSGRSSSRSRRSRTTRPSKASRSSRPPPTPRRRSRRQPLPARTPPRALPRRYQRSAPTTPAKPI